MDRGLARYDGARNASFNLHRLGVDVLDYLTDFYGAMSDGVNDGQPTDRLLVGWQLRTHRPDPPAGFTAAPAVTVGAAGEPIEADGGPTHFVRTRSSARLTIPSDIGSLRHHDPQIAHRWRDAIRRWLGGLLTAGWTVTAFDRESGYLLARPAP